MLAVNAACVMLGGPMKLRRRCSAKARTVFVTAVAAEETAVAAAVADASPRASVRKKQKIRTPSAVVDTPAGRPLLEKMSI